MLATEGLVIHAVNDWFGVPISWQLLIAGLALILTIMFNPVGIAGAASQQLRRRGAGRRPLGPPAEGPSDGDLAGRRVPVEAA
jgi:hypothetical protein